MRKLVYILENGTIETSYRGAIDSGMKYTVALENLHEEGSALAEWQAKKLKTATLRK